MIQALDLLNEVADRLGKPQIETLETTQPLAEHRKILRTLNTVLQQVGAYNDWPLLRDEGSIVLVASEQTDADSSEFVTATQNSDTITVAGQAFTETYTNRAIQVSGIAEIYRIKEVVSPTSVKLDRAWVQSSITVADEHTATIAMDRYALPTDFGRPVDGWQSFFAPYGIPVITPNEFYERRLRRGTANILLTEPQVCTVYGTTENGNAQMLHFDPWPQYARVLRFPYHKLHPVIDSDQDVILYPLTYREPLIEIILAIHNRDYEDSAKMEKVMQDSIRSHNMQQSNPGLNDAKPRLEPSGETRASVYESYRGSGADVDWGDWFDTGRIYGL